jgi:hypothetical protein
MDSKPRTGVPGVVWMDRHDAARGAVGGSNGTLRATR